MEALNHQEVSSMAKDMAGLDGEADRVIDWAESKGFFHESTVMRDAVTEGFWSIRNGNGNPLYDLTLSVGGANGVCLVMHAFSDDPHLPVHGSRYQLGTVNNFDGVRIEVVSVIHGDKSGHTEDDDTLFLHYGDDDLTGRVSDWYELIERVRGSIRSDWDERHDVWRLPASLLPER